ncbi:Crp/Fnr family transcriptional regulator [Inmirania thermothiophila]|uniref:CRP-like cAMP-binding protein n=1 Tax=Inmirania thermothiophila TaxID=1750597 RepID=A0A3N1XTF0_9GAMM|nr:Crp/Fnr family transcriptional regulator [Inmirania thermothiophila]ROR29528.1 CRP-like cAMP-binding protein [Inmirania thermothiophila]
MSGEIIDILAGIPLFQQLDPRHLEEIAAGTRVVELARGEILFHKGDRPTGFHCVLEGQIKLAMLSEDGAEKVLELLGPGRTFGEAVMFLDRPYPAYAQALRASRLLHVGRCAVLRHIEDDPAFARALLSGLAQRLHHLVREVEDLTLHSATQRVIGYLLGDEPDGGRHSVRLPASKAVVASRLNLTPETFSRVLHELGARGLVTVEGRTVHLRDVEGLRRLGHC